MSHEAIVMTMEGRSSFVDDDSIQLVQVVLFACSVFLRHIVLLADTKPLLRQLECLFKRDRILQLGLILSETFQVDDEDARKHH